MDKIKQLTGWGKYSSEPVIEYKGRYIHTTKYTDECGVYYYMLFTSINKYVSNCLYLWTNKNSNGRKFNTRFFVTQKEAAQAGMKRIDDQLGSI